MAPVPERLLGSSLIFQLLLWIFFKRFGSTWVSWVSFFELLKIKLWASEFNKVSECTFRLSFEMFEFGLFVKERPRQTLQNNNKWRVDIRLKVDTGAQFSADTGITKIDFCKGIGFATVGEATVKGF